MMLADEVQTAYSAFVQRVAAAAGDDAVGRRITEAYQQYASAAGAAMAQAGPAFDSYRAVLRASLGNDEARPRVSEAFTRFVRSVAAAWESPSADPGAVAAAAEVMLAAAFVAHVATEPAGSEPAGSEPAGAEPAAAEPALDTATGHPGQAQNGAAPAAAIWGTATVLD